MTKSPRARYAWTSLLLVALIPLSFGVKGLITGAPGNPAVVRALTGWEWDQLRLEQPAVARLVTLLARHEALALLGWGFWLTWSVLQAPRSSTRWAWFGWWTVPFLTAGFVLTGTGTGGVLRPVLLGVTSFAVIALVLSRPLFLDPPTSPRASSGGDQRAA